MSNLFVLECSRETESIVCIEMIYYKELAHIIMEAEKSPTCCVQARDSGEPVVSSV